MTLYDENTLVPPYLNFVSSYLDIYVTDEESFIPYYSEFNSYVSTSEEDEKSDLDSEYFTLHQGEILKTYTHNNIISIDFNKDYEGFSGDATVKIPFKKDYLKYIYKGVRCCLHVNRFNNEGINLNDNIIDNASELLIETSLSSEEIGFEPRKSYYDLKNDSMLCFITDLKFSTDGITISLSSYEKLLEIQGKVTFNQMLRSDIIKEVIKLAGLIPHVDSTGLIDEVIDYTSISSSDSENIGEASLGEDCTDTNSMSCKRGASHGNAGTGDNFDDCYKTGYAEEDTDYYKWARKFKSDKEMLKALRNIWSYSSYSNNITCPQKLFNESGFSSNCYDACRLVKCLLDSRGGKCVVITGSIYQGGHGWNCIDLGNGWKTFDLCYKSHMGETGGTNELGV